MEYKEDKKDIKYVIIDKKRIFYISYVLLLFILFIFGFGSECFSTDVFCRAGAEEKSAESEYRSAVERSVVSSGLCPLSQFILRFQQSR